MCQVPLDYLWHFLGRHPGIPDVVGIDEDDRALVVTPGTGVAQYRGRQESAPLELHPERLDQVGATFGTAAPLPRGSAHKNLSKPSHGLIL
jgi:hypothetical protein